MWQIKKKKEKKYRWLKWLISWIRGETLLLTLQKKMNYKGILWTVICQQIMWPRWNRQILRKTTAEVDLRRNRKSEQTYNKWFS